MRNDIYEGCKTLCQTDAFQETKRSHGHLFNGIADLKSVFTICRITIFNTEIRIRVHMPECIGDRRTHGGTDQIPRHPDEGEGAEHETESDPRKEMM